MPDKELVPFAGGAVPGIDLRSMRRSVLVEGGLLTPRKRYESAEERKIARKARSKARREERRALLASKGLVPEKRPKLSKAAKKARSKEFRRIRNIYLRAHPKEAEKLGISLGRLRV